MNDSLLEASAQVALLAYLQQIGKLAERAGIPTNESSAQQSMQRYSPTQQAIPQKYAAYTAIALDKLKSQLPELGLGQYSPCSSWNEADSIDSFVHIAASAQQTESFLPCILTTASHLAAGKSYRDFHNPVSQNRQSKAISKPTKIRLSTLFEQIDPHKKVKPAPLQYRYPLCSLSPYALMPEKNVSLNNNESKKQYSRLWEDFSQAFESIPHSHRQSLPLWLDHFDSLWLCYTQAVPVINGDEKVEDVSIYDHSKITAALATALWRNHYAQSQDEQASLQALQSENGWNEEKFLLIQGDFFGIQNFIFSSGAETNRRAAKLLRGRSFQVSLIAECIALNVLEALQLPSTSQVLNAAGKFLIIAPNLPHITQALEDLKNDINQWFLEISYGQSGMGLCWHAASCNNFVNTPGESSGYAQLMSKLAAEQERAKHQHFGLCEKDTLSPVFSHYLDSMDNEFGVCEINGFSPAQQKVNQEPQNEENQKKCAHISELAADQISMGEALVSKQRLLITRTPLQGLRALKIPILGYAIQFTDEEDVSGKFGAEVKSGNLRRVWDYSLPEQNAKAPLWNGYARRFINSQVPRFEQASDWEKERYQLASNEDATLEIGALKTFNHIACEDRSEASDHSGWQGINALGIFKGDVDDLGLIFSNGLPNPSFARTSALSRQINQFFTIYLPWLCQSDDNYKNTYTLFAGGDDFFMLGPWHTQMQLALALQEQFQHYVAHNAAVHFSAGLALTKPGLPIKELADLGEQALNAAKSRKEGSENVKNAICCFEQTVSWDTYKELLATRQRLSELSQEFELSTAYLYALLDYCHMAQQAKDGNTEAAIWRSRLVYKTERMIIDRHKTENTQRAKDIRHRLFEEIILNGIQAHHANWLISLQTHLYLHRKIG